jgi:hypothetical protein
MKLPFFQPRIWATAEFLSSGPIAYSSRNSVRFAFPLSPCTRSSKALALKTDDAPVARARAFDADGIPRPYWGIYCLYCQGYILDALLECLPADKKRHAAFKLLFAGDPGAALACPYCNGFISFNDSGQPCAPESGWPVFRYAKTELEQKKFDDYELPSTSLATWALKHRFIQPGAHLPLVNYVYAEQAPPNETVP